MWSPCEPGVACSMWMCTRTPPVVSSVKVAVPVTVEPLLDSMVAFARGPSAAWDEAQPTHRSRPAPARSRASVLVDFIFPLLLSSRDHKSKAGAKSIPELRLLGHTPGGEERLCSNPFLPRRSR